MPPRCSSLGGLARRRRALVLVIVALLILTQVGCKRRASALTRIRESGILRVALDPAFPPFESVADSGEIVGLDVDLATRLAESLGVQAHFVTTGYDALYDALTVGRADVIISALYPDPARSAGFAFSTPYFNAGDVLVVPAGSPIGNAADLPGATIACVFGTTAHMAALEWTTSLTPPPVLITVDTPVTLTTTLRDGSADAVIVDHVSAEMAAGADLGLQILSPPVTDEPYVIAARREDAGLMAALEESLEEMRREGDLEALIRRWMQP